MFIAKRLEAYAVFAKFCIRYEVRPDELAEVIQLVNDCKTIKGWATLQTHKDEIRKRLQSMGFTEVNTLEEVSFRDKDGDLIRLPEIV
jgi:hypothetical protein